MGKNSFIEKIKNSSLKMQTRVGIAVGFFLAIVLISSLFLFAFSIEFQQVTGGRWDPNKTTKNFDIKLADWADSPIIGTHAEEARGCYAVLITLFSLSIILSAVTLGVYFATLEKPIHVINKVTKFMLAMVILSIILFGISAYFFYATNELRSTLEGSLSHSIL
ncbi:hypothetical protein [Mycoplasma todarodis]|uniref:hypothetical protein n=1 Tax=Mycoplasma todarodis TaxID=1937191 RepID=UPI003B2A0689